VLAQLKSRNAKERGKWCNVFCDVDKLRHQLEAAKANQFVLQREAVAASVSCPDADLSGLLADTPVAPHMREQLSAALRIQLAPPNGRPVPLDPLLITGCHAVIACLVGMGSASATPTSAVSESEHTAAMRASDASPSATDRTVPKTREGEWLDALCIGDLEACFAGSVCAALVAHQPNARAFELHRMHRLIARFRALIADACYGSVFGDVCSASHSNSGTPHDEETLRRMCSDDGNTPWDDKEEEEVPLTPHEELIYCKARRHVTGDGLISICLQFAREECSSDMTGVCVCVCVFFCVCVCACVCV
jgi:hypothetical protein